MTDYLKEYWHDTKIALNSRIYIKIFLGFWVVTIGMVIGSNVLVHWFNLGPDKHITAENNQPGDRLLHEIVSDAINYNYEEIQEGLRAMPSWVTRYVFLINEQGKDLLDREIPPERHTLLNQLTTESPYFRKQLSDGEYIYGRRFQLSDGQFLRLLLFPPPNYSALKWRLFFSNFWYILLLNVLISGAACFYFSRYITRDINTLKNATQRLAQGDWTTRIGDELCNHPGELADLGKAFDDMAQKLQEAMLEQKRLIKDVSHELRSPLARLQVALGIAQQRANEEISDELVRIKAAADYLNDVISDILALPMNEEDEWELTDVVELGELLRAVRSACRTEAELKHANIKFNRKVDEALVMTRGNTLVGVFDNIVRNAIHHTPAQSSIQICLFEDSHQHVVAEVTDAGDGVLEEHLGDIFEPFFRTDEARDRESGGYGLGLAIAQRTVMLHGGTIEACNNPKGGLTIRVTLPREQLD